MPDDLGDRMKGYEGAECARRFMPMLPVLARIDGKCFHKYTKNMERPFDRRLIDLMVAVTAELVQETNALIGYTQSDEINLVWFSDDPKSQIFFDGKIHKMVSVLASMATLAFERLHGQFFADASDPLRDTRRHPISALGALFDCRCWQVPNKTEATNCFVWREQDATRNSIESASRCYYSHDQLYKKSCPEMHEMLFRKGVNWNDYPLCFKRGVYVQCRHVTRKFTVDEIERLPEKHEARQNPDLEVLRSEVAVLDMPPIVRVINRVEVVFDGAKPEVESKP